MDTEFSTAGLTAPHLGHSGVPDDEQVVIEAQGARLGARLLVPDHAHGTVVVAQPSSLTRHGSQERFVAGMLARAGLATLLLDLLTEDEDERTELHDDVPLLADRMVAATDWLAEHAPTANLPVGYLGVGTAAAASLVAAAMRPGLVQAIVSREGRPDLGGASLYLVRVPTLLVVGAQDGDLLAANHSAFSVLRGEKQFEVLPGAKHHFRDGPALDRLIALVCDWFSHRLDPALLPADGW